MVQWTGEKDAIVSPVQPVVTTSNPSPQLLRGIFEKCDIKFGKELCEDLAKRIGEGMLVSPFRRSHSRPTLPSTLPIDIHKPHTKQNPHRLYPKSRQHPSAEHPQERQARSRPHP